MTPSTPDRPLVSIVMRRAAAVLGAVVLLALALGLLRATGDIDEEVRGAQALAVVMAELQALQSLDDRAALQRLQALSPDRGLRHLQLTLHDAHGQVLWSTGSGASVPTPVDLTWPVARPHGPAWTVTLSASGQAEQHEALWNLAGALLVGIVGAAALLGVMRWNLEHAFRPLTSLLQAIDGVQRQDTEPVRRLPRMPIQELESLAGALRHLAQSLDHAQARRRVLAQKVLTLQEDERAHLARELHDEMGQRLTSMRFDAAWLARKLPEGDERQAVVRRLAQQCEDLQVDMRQMLVRLRPLSSVSPSDPQAGEAIESTLARLLELIDSLVQAWSSQVHPRLQVQRVFETQSPQTPIPRALALGVYRMTQEALTNAARHSGGQSVLVRLSMPHPHELAWSVEDDGRGLEAGTSVDLDRGAGLSGMRERAWSLGSELRIEPARPGPGPGPGPGLRLRAEFRWNSGPTDVADLAETGDRGTPSSA